MGSQDSGGTHTLHLIVQEHRAALQNVRLKKISTSKILLVLMWEENFLQHALMKIQGLAKSLS